LRLRDRLTRLASRRQAPRRTVRLRLTMLYGGLFLASGAALLAITYVLVVHATSGFIFKGQNGAAGSIVTSSSQKAPPHTRAGETSLSAQGPGTRGLTRQQLEAQARALEAQAERQHASVLHQLLVQSGIALAAMALASIALGWIIAGRALRPLRTITTAARRISATSLHERLALDGPDDELKELGDTFDALLARLDASFRSQRQFVANASHELRTPLARQRTVAQVALGDPDATVDSLRAAHERVLVSGAQQERLIEALLTLSRGEAGLERREPLDLAELTDQVLIARHAAAERLGVDLRAALSPARVTGDPRLVERLIANLVDNALRHNVSGGHAEVATATRRGRAVLSVSNSGPAVPSGAVERLLQPFQRLGAERTTQGDGVGLGLSIVQAIANAHGAALELEPRAGGGLRIEVSFEACAPARRLTPAPLRA
jgi:signal transduction histidine kinase